ncbi:MAG: type II toxin-antitoxin system RelB/DinJ family antitoxin [Lachnospiraceae bacterium]|nr:type II toxin-antitoxin system RelB/DinJ family antitoxin [Lachnospiraceae bacterium]
MAVKTANVSLRMKLDIKQQAEEILERLGIPRSVAIDMFYRQIIAHNGIPFSLTLPETVPVRGELTSVQFNQMMAVGLKQAKEDDSFDVDEVFEELERRSNV